MEIRNILNKIQSSQKGAFFISLLLIITSTRFIPHPPNLTPITGLALFSGHFSRENNKLLVLPLLVMFFSDLFLGFHSTTTFVYGSFLIISLAGRLLLKKYSLVKLTITSLFSSLVFYLITNFGVWLTSTMYIKNINGLVNCYIMGVPFFRNMVFGDILYTLVFFYGHSLAVYFSSNHKKSFINKSSR